MVLEKDNCVLENLPFKSIIADIISEQFIMQFKLLAPTVVSESYKSKAITILAQNISRIAQVTFHDAFKKHRSVLREKGIKTKFYNSFIDYYENGGKLDINSAYSLLPVIIEKLCSSYLSFHLDLIERLITDREEIFKNFNIPINAIAENIRIGNGNQFERKNSTAIIHFDTGHKLVYKPRNQNISYAYNKLLDWVNLHSEIKLSYFKFIDKDIYGWLEFIEQKPCDTEEDVKLFWKRAGCLIAISYFLRSGDLHYENIIACGNCPVIIDHETVLQPLISILYYENRDADYIEYNSTVLSSGLLPTGFKNYGISNPFMSGFGALNSYKPGHKVQTIKQANTDKAYLATDKELIDEANNNVIFHGKRIRPNLYSDEIILGFSYLYNLIEERKLELNKENSVLSHFKNVQIRYIFRSTGIYFRILNLLNTPNYLSKPEERKMKLIDSMSHIFRKRKSLAYLSPLLDSEIEQMNNLDVPIFYASSSSKDLIFPNGEKLKDVFEDSCINIVQQKIRNASSDDMNHQIDLIRRSLNGEFSRTP